MTGCIVLCGVLRRVGSPPGSMCLCSGAMNGKVSLSKLSAVLRCWGDTVAVRLRILSRPGVHAAVTASRYPEEASDALAIPGGPAGDEERFILSMEKVLHPSWRWNSKASRPCQDGFPVPTGSYKDRGPRSWSAGKGTRHRKGRGRLFRECRLSHRRLLCEAGMACEIYVPQATSAASLSR